VPESKQILIVDDEPGICLGFAAALQGWGYRTITAFNGKDALALAKKHIPDAIFLDLIMPKMDGLEMLKHLKSDSQVSHIPVVMITAKADLPDKVKAAEACADYYVTKPVMLETLKDILNKVFPQDKQ